MPKLLSAPHLSPPLPFPLCTGIPLPSSPPPDLSASLSTRARGLPVSLKDHREGKWWPPFTGGCDKCYCVVLDCFFIFPGVGLEQGVLCGCIRASY